MLTAHVMTTLDADLAEALDRFVASRPRNDHTEAMEAALAEKVGRVARTLLAREEGRDMEPMAGIEPATC